MNEKGNPNENGVGKRDKAKNPELRDLGKISCRHCGETLISTGMLISPVSAKIAGGTQLTIWQLVSVVIGEHIGMKHPKLAVVANAMIPELINNLAMGIAASHITVAEVSVPEVDLLNIGDSALDRIDLMLLDISTQITENRELAIKDTEEPADPNPLSDPPPQPPKAA